MFLNILLDIEDKSLQDNIQKELNSHFQYHSITYKDLKEPMIIFKEINTLQQLKTMKNKMLPQHTVIFIINNPEYMFLSLDQYPLCFIRKESFIEDLQKAVEFIKNIHQNIEQVLTLKIGYSYIQLNTSQIVYIESLGHYLIFHTQTGEYRTREKIKSILKELPRSFEQVHKSFIVNKEYIVKSKTNELEMIKGISIPRGRAFK